MSEVVGLRLGRAGLMVGLLIALTACDIKGFSGLEDEWARRKATGPFSVVNVSHERAVVSARGRQVAIEPADGFCLAKESIETSGRSAFVLIGDCALDAPTGDDRSARGELQLPKGIPGFITVSISGSSAFPVEGSQDATLADLSGFLETPDGRRMLGRGGDGNDVDIVSTRRIGESLYVLVEDKTEQPVALLSPRFWRSFVELNDRLAVVTISGFRDRPMGESDMLDHLVNQVKRLKLANRVPINEEEVRIAARVPEDLSRPEPGTQRISDLKPTAVIVTAKETGAQELWPLPTAKTGEEGGNADQNGIGGAEELEIEVATSAVPRSRPASAAQDKKQVKDTPLDKSGDQPTASVALTNPSDSQVDTTAAVAADSAPGTATRNAPQTAPSAPRRPKRV